MLPGKPRARKPGEGGAASGGSAGGAGGGEEGVGGQEGNSSFKRKREEELKASAGSGHNWNPLFMRADAIGDAMAER